ncbi:MAG: Gfo/Idh/MocA family oxidoreductase [Gemmatimonadota bacterium]|nr:MAG: Gfo/Idh/MocA family oxidoreductase [Gemmatimonadota bacterium]
MNDEHERAGGSRPAGEGSGGGSTGPSPEVKEAGEGLTGGTRGIARRDVLKALASIPVLGVFFYSFFQKKLQEDFKRGEILAELGVREGAPAIIPNAISRPPGELIRVGIIGFGGEGESLVRHAGYAHPDWIEESRKETREDPRKKNLETHLSQEDLNIAITAVCDVFDVRAERGLAASSVDLVSGGGPQRQQAKRYLRYTDLLESGDVDAVIIATPDHWHSRMTIDAVAAGKHIYCEKCMTRTEEETHAVHEAVKGSDIVFQLGHQNRQSESHIKAQEVIAADILGPLTLVETTTNRNDPWGAWVYDIHEEGSPETIDWAQFEEPAPHKVPFSLERFFRWRCWFDYGTGLSGDLLSHEYDAVNQILGLGIPKTAVASGGVYYFKDGRDVPDVFQAVFEYPERDLTLVYSATLANGKSRGKLFMGHDATMEVGSGLTIRAESSSTRYEQKIKDGIIDPSLPLFTYRPGFRGIDAVTSATEEYFVSRGLLYTYRGGRRVSAYHLHIKEWLDVIRNGGQVSCDIERGFEEAITCHMATRSLLLGRKVEWDPVNRRIV